MTYVDPYSGGSPGGSDPGQGTGPGQGPFGAGPSPYASPGYGAPGYGAPGYGQPRRRRGLKRIIVGSIGIVLNALGLVVMPILASVVGALIAMGTATEPVPLAPTGGSVPVEAMSMTQIAVPRDDTLQVTCTAAGAEMEPVSPPTGVGEVDGVSYVAVYQITGSTTTEVTVECTGASALAYTETGLVGVLVAVGIGFVIPILLGIVSIVLLIWGIIARVRS